MKKIIKNTGKQLGKLALDTAAKAVKEPLGLEKLTGSSSASAGQTQVSGQGNKVSSNIAQMMKKDQLSSEAEMAALRAQIAQDQQPAAPGPIRNVEKEIEQVRVKKEQLMEQKERQLLAEIEEKRREENALAQQDTIATNSRPKRGSAMARGKGKKGTKETDMRRSV